MATRTTITLVDDLDGTAAEETVAFGLNGATYEIDLSDANAAALRDAVAHYIASARRVGGRRTPGSRPTAASTSRGAAASRSAATSSAARSQEENWRIRTWASEHGAFVPDRGRIPGLLVTAYEASDPSLLPAAAGSGAAAATATPAAAESTRAPASETPPSTLDTAEKPQGRDGLTAAEREQIRAWAVEEGIEVKTRGQLKKDLIANYEATTARR